MNNYIYHIKGSDKNYWLLYAKTVLNISTNEAEVLWNNENLLGKFLICESRDNTKRMYIRDITQPYTDALKKDGWWNTFTLSEHTIPKNGLYLCKVVEYRLDKNGYVNLIVNIMKEFPKLENHKFLSTYNGTYQSPALWFMITYSGKFLDEYKFLEPPSAFEGLNIKELRNRLHPKSYPKSNREFAFFILCDWLAGDIELKDIEDALSAPTDYEIVLNKIRDSIINRTLVKNFGEKYPLMTKKIQSQIAKDGWFSRYDIDSYIYDRIISYEYLLRNGKIKSVEDKNDKLAQVETVLQYYEDKKQQEKLAKKLARKAKKKNKVD